MTEQEFLNRYDSGGKFEESEIGELVWEFPQLAYIEGDETRWSRITQTVVEVGGRSFSVTWQRGLTERQENYYDEQPIEVQKQEYQKTNTVVEWIPVNKEK